MKNDNKKIVYITTNGSWSGSEELWVRSAKDLQDNGYSIVFMTKYSHQELCTLKGKHYIFSKRFKKNNYFKRVLEKVFRISFKSEDLVSEILKKESPKFVVISQGKNIDHDGIMKCCHDLKTPYFTITHLVTEFFFLDVNATNLDGFKQGYLRAVKNFFVSQRNLQLNNLMFAVELPNAEVIYNPCKISKDEISIYPLVDTIYNVALVGRIECFHKGYDLLLELANKEKWKQRAVDFNVYGEGPHKELLQRNISRLKLKNITLKGYEKSVGKIWKENHILFMPSRMEGQSLALIEAMYCHRAAVVTDVGGATELVEDGYNGFIAESASIESLDNALERAWNKKETWEELGRNAAVALKEKYSENAVEYFNEKILSESFS